MRLETIIPVCVPKVVHPVTSVNGPSTPIEGGSSKHACLLEGGRQKVLTPFFRIPTILPSRLPRTPEEFIIVMVFEDLDFVLGLSAIDRKSLFADVSLTLFRARSLVSILVVSQDNFLGSDDLSRERDKRKERCEALEWKNSYTYKELVELWENVVIVNSLQEEVDWYGRPSTLASHIKKLEVSLAD